MIFILKMPILHKLYYTVYNKLTSIKNNFLLSNCCLFKQLSMLPPKHRFKSLTPLQPLPKRTCNIFLQNNDNESPEPYKLVSTSKAFTSKASISKASSSKVSSSKASFSKTSIFSQYDDDDDDILETSNFNDIIDLLQAEENTLGNNL